MLDHNNLEEFSDPENDLTIIRQYGDWNGEPLTAASPSIVTVSRLTFQKSG